MKKHFFRVLALVLLVLFPIQNALAEYCTMSGNMSQGGRKLNSFTLSDGVNSVSLSSIQTSYTSAIYYDGTSSVLTTSPGATLSFSALDWTGSWMHAYVFIDYSQDETFDQTLNADGTTGGELVSYNFYSSTGAATGTNSLGTTTSNNCGVTQANMPSWTLPTTLAAGDYRLRFNVAWNSIDPCGYTDMAANGGAMVDVILRVEAATTARTITVAKNPAEGGTVTINGSDVESLNAEGNITLVATANRGYDFTGWTLEGETVSTDVTYIDATAGDKTYTANFAAKTAYPVMTYVYTNNLQQANRYLKEVVATQGENVTTVFSATTEDELPRVDPTATNTAMTEAQGALVDKTATPIIIEQGATEFTVNFKGWTESMTIGGTASATQLQWTQQALFIDWNNNFDFYDEGENYGKSSNTMGNDGGVCESFISADGYTRTISIPSGVEPGTYRMRVSYNEPTDNSAAWDQTLFTTMNCQTRNGKSYDFAIQVVAGATPRTITLEATPAEGGVVKANDTVGGVADAEGIVTIVAEASEGYRFVNWTNKATSEVVSEEATFTNNEEGDVTYVATFEIIPTYNVTVTLPDAAQGAIQINGEAAQSSYTVYEGTAVEMTAIPAYGYAFSKWIINGSEYGENPFSVPSINIDATVEALFVAQTDEEIYASLCKPSYSGAGNTTFVSSASMNVSTDTTTIDLGTLGVLGQNGYIEAAEVYAGEVFNLNLTYTLNWGDLTLYQIEKGEATAIYGPFEGSWVSGGSTATVLTNIVNAGLTVNGTTVAYPITISNDAKVGDLIIIRAMTGGSSACETGINEGGYLDFIFKVAGAPVPTYAVSAEAAPAEGGQVTISANEVEENGTVELTATANEGYEFVNWTVNETEVSTEASFTSEAISAETVFVANFQTKEYTITYIVDGEEYATDTYAFGAAVTAQAAPEKEGCTFSGWSEVPATMPANDVEVTGTFTVNSYTITYTVDGEEYATDTYAFGAVVTAQVAPEKEGYTFSGWSEIPETMPASDVEVTGTFTINSYTITYIVDGEEVGSETYAYGATVTAMGTPVKEGYTFSGWSEVPSTMPANDVEVTGTFTVNSYTITYIVDGENYATETYDFGATVTPIAAPTKAGYTFSGWSTIPATMPANDVEVTGTFSIKPSLDVTTENKEESTDAEYSTVTVANEQVWDVQANTITADKVAVKVEADGTTPEIKIEDGGQITAVLEVSRVVEKEKWALMSLPFAVDLANVTVDGAPAVKDSNIKVLVYDASYRATN
ncbi:MAG: InlB B-repeat-containing protein, partial [Bacteroidales bacterium]|nr:InlB B-repeat-containing protein [Bacteroidales bacterium]